MVALLGLALATTLRPPPVEGADVQLYRVRGADVQAVGEAMRRRTPYRDPKGRRYHGGMWYKVRWSWRRQAGGTCRVRPLDVAVIVVLPRVRTEPAVEERVADYLDALVVHEQGHVDRVWEGVRALEQELAAIPPGPCPQVGDAVRRAGEAALDVINTRNDAYDRETRHGATQGARL